MKMTMVHLVHTSHMSGEVFTALPNDSQKLCLYLRTGAGHSNVHTERRDDTEDGGVGSTQSTVGLKRISALDVVRAGSTPKTETFSLLWFFNKEIFPSSFPYVLPKVLGFS